MAISATDVAAYLIGLGEVEEDRLTALKLQKLLYYCQGFHLAMHDKPLFKEAVVAWEHGPVVAEVWRQYRAFGDAPIYVPAEERKEPKLTAKQEELIGEVFRVYGQFSAWRLRQMTHDEAPWKETKRNAVISHAKMKACMKAKLVA